MSSGATLVDSPMETQPSLDEAGARSGWFSWLPSWTPTSEELLQQAERRVLEGLQSSYRDVFVPIGSDATIRTIIMEPEVPQSPERTPLVMIHGFGAGLLAFYKNFDHLHATRRLYALDLPGFARSSRISFSKDAESVENEFVEAIEKWRQGIGLQEFVLLGHSLGAFLSTAYAMKHPNSVRHLILVDPWGFPIRPVNPEEGTGGRKLPMWVAALASLLTVFNPLTPVRMAGPLGPYLMNRVRPDLYRKFGEDFMEYVYHCNVQNPSGETAFFYLQIPFAWARRPMLERIGTELDSRVPITFLYGVRSWMDSSSGEEVTVCRPNSYVKLHNVQRSGHHVHAEQPEAFNDLVNATCAMVDCNEDLITPTPPSL